MTAGKGFSLSLNKEQEGKIFPRFVYHEEYADPGFSHLIRTTIQSFSFFELPKEKQNFLKKIRKEGYRKVAKHILQKSGTLEGNAAWIDHGIFLGDFIFKKTNQYELKKYIPYNDVQFLFSANGRKIIVYFRKLKTQRTNRGNIYHSQLEPKIEIDGEKYIVAFSRHAIERICERIAIEPNSYAVLGDVFAYLDTCNSYEICRLQHDNSWAITFWDSCGIPPIWTASYVHKVLGVENYDPKSGKVYYRVGYCPIAIEGRFAVIKTLLYPGFGKTPEYNCLRNSNLPSLQKKEMLSKARYQDARTLFETKDFSCIKWFHDHAVPQVMQSKEELYSYQKAIPQSVLDIFN